MPQPLRASPIQIERHEFLDVEVHAAESEGAHTSLPLTINRNFAQHANDPFRWRVELKILFGGEREGKPSVYSGQIRIAGYFRVHEKCPEEKVTQLVEVTGASILYGACREMLANLTARGSHGVVSLPSVSFVPPPKVPLPPPRLEECPTAYRAKRPASRSKVTK